MMKTKGDDAVKKCSRCNTVLTWDKPYCPLCGGYTVDYMEPVRKVEQAQAAAPVDTAPAEEAPAAVHPEPTPAETQAPAETPRPAADIPARPAPSIPGLEYLEEEEEAVPAAPAAAAPAALAPAPEKLDLLEPMDLSSASVGGIQKGSSDSSSFASHAGAGEKLELSGETFGGATFSKIGGAAPSSPAPAPAPSSEPPSGEFLKMFPDAKPE